jgi:hypothetical protein
MWSILNVIEQSCTSLVTSLYICIICKIICVFIFCAHGKGMSWIGLAVPLSLNSQALWSSPINLMPTHARTVICATCTYFKLKRRDGQTQESELVLRAARIAQCRAEPVCNVFTRSPHCSPLEKLRSCLGKTAASTETTLSDHSVKQHSANLTSFPLQISLLSTWYQENPREYRRYYEVLSSKALSPRLVWSWPLIWPRISTSWESFGQRAQSSWSQSVQII